MANSYLPKLINLQKTLRAKEKHLKTIRDTPHGLGSKEQVDEYNKQVDEYNEQVRQYKKISKAVMTANDFYKIPNPKNPHEWLAGGTFYNEKNAGGYIFSATNPLSANEKPNNKDLGFILNTKTMHHYLNEGFTQVQGTLKSFSFLDLLGDYNKTEQGFLVCANFTNFSNLSTDFFSKTIHKQDMNETMAIIQSNMTIEAIATMLGTKGFDFMNLNKIALVEFTITNLVNGKLFSSKMKAGDLIAATVYTSVKNSIASNLSNAIGKALGVSNIFSNFAVSVGVLALVQEFFENIIGFDNHFGFGGEFRTKDAFGNPLYQDKTFSKNFTEDLKSALGIDYNSFGTLSNKDGDVVGAWQDYKDDNFEVSGNWSDDDGFSGWEVTQHTKAWGDVTYKTDSSGDYTITVGGATWNPKEVEEEIDREIDDWDGDSGGDGDGDYGDAPDAREASRDWDSAGTDWA